MIGNLDTEAPVSRCVVEIAGRDAQMGQYGERVDHPTGGSEHRLVKRVQ